MPESDRGLVSVFATKLTPHIFQVWRDTHTRGVVAGPVRVASLLWVQLTHEKLHLF